MLDKFHLTFRGISTHHPGPRGFFSKVGPTGSNSCWIAWRWFFFFFWPSTSNPKCHVTFSKTKMNVNWHIHFIRKCHLNLGLHNLEKTNTLNNLNPILICNKRKLSIEHKYSLVSHVFPNVEDASPIHCIYFKPTKRDLHKSIKVAFNCILLLKWLQIAFRLENPLTNSYTWWNEYNFLPKLHKFRHICAPFQIDGIQITDSTILLPPI